MFYSTTPKRILDYYFYSEIDIFTKNPKSFFEGQYLFFYHNIFYEKFKKIF